MHLSWLGQTCVKLQTKNLDEDVTVLIDAYKPARGEFPRSFTVPIALYSRGLDNASTVLQNPFVIDTLGEFEIKNVLINTWPGPAGEVIYKINAENISVAHLGKITKKISDETIEKMGNVDILFVPVGNGKNYLSAELAVEIINDLEPRVVIPIGYECDTDPEAAALSVFLKELGQKPASTDKKFIIKKKDLPPDKMTLMILEKNV